MSKNIGTEKEIKLQAHNCPDCSEGHLYWIANYLHDGSETYHCDLCGFWDTSASLTDFYSELAMLSGL